MNHTDESFGDWIMAEHSVFSDRRELTKIMLRKSEISEVVNDNNGWCVVYMKNGRGYFINIPYNNILSMLT